MFLIFYFVVLTVSSIQPNPQPQNKSTEQTPNIIQTFNRHGNDFDKSKKDEVSLLHFVNFKMFDSFH